MKEKGPVIPTKKNLGNDLNVSFSHGVGNFL
jgi:hypothetical protein